MTRYWLAFAAARARPHAKPPVRYPTHTHPTPGLDRSTPVGGLGATEGCRNCTCRPTSVHWGSAMGTSGWYSCYVYLGPKGSVSCCNALSSLRHPPGRLLGGRGSPVGSQRPTLRWGLESSGTKMSRLEKEAQPGTEVPETGQA